MKLTVREVLAAFYPVHDRDNHSIARYQVCESGLRGSKRDEVEAFCSCGRLLIITPDDAKAKGIKFSDVVYGLTNAPRMGTK